MSNTDGMLFTRAQTVLQQQLAAAMVELVADIEREQRETGHSINGVYRLKLEGGSITASFERYHSTRKVHNIQSGV